METTTAADQGSGSGVSATPDVETGKDEGAGGNSGESHSNSASAPANKDTKKQSQRSRTRKPPMIDGVIEIKMPPLPEVEVVSDDEEMPNLPNDVSKPPEGFMSTGERIRWRKLKQAEKLRVRNLKEDIKLRNLARDKRRRNAAATKIKNLQLSKRREEVREAILNALDMENLQELDEALDAARECGLEGKNKRGAWRCSEMKEAYRSRPRIEKRFKDIEERRKKRAAEEEEAFIVRRDANEEHKKIRDMMAPYPVRTQMLGKDANYNRYWIFAGVPGVVFKEVQEVAGSEESWSFYTPDQIIEFVASLDDRGIRECELKKALETEFFDR